MDKRCLICYIRSLNPKRIVIIVNHAAVDVVGDSCYHGQNQQQPHQLPQAASRLFDGLLWWYRTVIGRCLRCLDRRPEVDWRVIFRPGDRLLNLLKNTTSWFLRLTLYPALVLPFHFPQCWLFALAWMEKNRQKTSFRVKYSESNEQNTFQSILRVVLLEWILIVWGHSEKPQCIILYSLYFVFYCML